MDGNRATHPPATYPVDGWCPSAGVKLEPNGEKAVAARVNVAVEAGPGAGKTELLAQRANFLFSEGHCPWPRRVVAIAFKVDAAANLRDRVKTRCKPSQAARFDSMTFHAFARQIISRHRPLVADRVPSDFRVSVDRGDRQLAYDDLLPLALEIVRKDPSAARVIQQAYAFAFFDEFQDCTAEQYELLHLLFCGSKVVATAVGDPKQRIMGFAGALPEAFAGFIKDFDAAELPIYLNHRSKPRLRRVQNAMVKIMDPGAAVPDLDLTPSFTDEPEDSVPEGDVAILQFADSAQEATTLASWIAKDIEAGVRPDQIAVITAQTPGAHCAELVAHLDRLKIPSRDDQKDQDSLAEPVGRLILALVRVLALGHAPGDYATLVDFMARNCYDERQAERRHRRLDAVLGDVRAELRDGAWSMSDATQLRNVVYRFLKVCDRRYLEHLSSDYTNQDLLTQVAGEAIDTVNRAIRDAPTLPAAIARLSQEDAVRLLTIHKSKGLEFEHVYLLGVENEVFFKAPDVERPNFFVGISRARTRLVLTTAARRTAPASAPRSWKVQRTPVDEFLAYAAPHVALRGSGPPEPWQNEHTSR